MEDKRKDALLAFRSKVNQELAKAWDKWMGWWTLWLRLGRCVNYHLCKIWTQVYLSWNQSLIYFLNIENVCFTKKKNVDKTSYVKILQFFLIEKTCRILFPLKTNKLFILITTWWKSCSFLDLRSLLMNEDLIPLS